MHRVSGLFYIRYLYCNTLSGQILDARYGEHSVKYLYAGTGFFNTGKRRFAVVYCCYLSDLRYLYTVMFGVESDLVLMENFTMFNCLTKLNSREAVIVCFPS